MKIKKLHDAYGAEILAHHEGRESYEIIEREGGFIDCYLGPLSYFRDSKKWPAYERRVLRQARGRVLDVGSGAGRVSLYLQKKGCQVTAIDNSPLALKVCRESGVKRTLCLPFEGIGKFRGNSFDTVVMYGNNFGLFGGFKKARRLLRTLFRITSPDSRIIAVSMDPYATKDPVHLAYHRFNRRRGRMGGQIRIRVRFRNYTGPWFDYLFVSRREMKSILEGTGWKVEKIIGSGGFPYVAVIGKTVKV